MEWLIDLLRANPLLLLFAVVALGYPLGRLKIGGSGLGVASVLFAGLAIGALDPDLKLPETVYQLGLVLFVYTIGLSNGRSFFASFRRRGLRDVAFVAGTLACAAFLTWGAFAGFGLSPGMAAGLFTGTGRSRCTTVPSPNWPPPFSPQHWTPPVIPVAS